MACRIDDDAMGCGLRFKHGHVSRVGHRTCVQTNLVDGSGAYARDEKIVAEHGQVVEQGESTRVFHLRKDDVTIESKAMGISRPAGKDKQSRQDTKDHNQCGGEPPSASCRSSHWRCTFNCGRAWTLFDVGLTWITRTGYFAGKWSTKLHSRT